MPITLIVRLSGKNDASHKLTFDGTRVVIGRGEGCDLRLPDPSVSHRHASIRAKGPEYSVVDEGSTNGTFIGGVRLARAAPRVVKSGDLLRVGRVWVEVKIGELAATPDLGMATRDLALALVSQAMSALGDDVVPKVRVVEGPDLGAELALAEEGHVYVVGRGEKCDLLLSDPDASREHAQIVKRGATVLVRDLGARNGVFLGESAIAKGRDVPWRSPVMVRLAGTVLALDEPVARALVDLEAGDDEKVAPGEEPPAPPPSAPAPSTADAPPSKNKRESSPPPQPASAAPIASLGETTQPAARNKKKAGFSPTDALVVVGAIVVIALSALALVWLLRAS
jgi:pSer/pThr/pTyr-binding forkhead associated (FHA) protein